ncbi:tRNA (adenosine(37)-N6)-threonylcarbamoyltransferase complex transferase subunit TsaD [Candidatus Roizmanbacteria bacterium]|nr:tRNA (adenosine(37)-N6)-threonylcarbamoyltransferase complex transferase subunit TsaD [Candidatus Roizmanbacteria bacterium]
MVILAIETSCDETAASVTSERRVLGNAVYSQVLIHKKWGGVVPSLAKRAHEERIDFVIEEALRKFALTNKILAGPAATFPPASARKKLRAVGSPSSRVTHQNFINATTSYIDHIAVTYGPGLAIALEVGINKAKELAIRYNKKVIPVNHMEGHIYSCFTQNSRGNPKRPFRFPYLTLLVSGGHTELVLFKDHITYQILGETVDDAAGEALDKAAKMLGLGYPGGPVIERLSQEVKNKDFYLLPRPMIQSKDLNFSFSGLKTSLFYLLKKKGKEKARRHIRELASSFQEAVFDSIVKKTETAIRQTGINRIVVGGGVSANYNLRTRLRALTEKYRGSVIFPPYPYLCGDNAAMVGVAAYYRAKKGQFLKNLGRLDRVPRLRLGESK